MRKLFRMKSKILTTLLLCIGLSFHAQSYTSFTPTKGEIIFREISKITDRKSFDESLQISKENFKITLKNSLLKEENNTGKEKEIEQMVSQNAEMMEAMMFLQDSSQTYTYRFDHSKIISTNLAEEELLGRYDVIDLEKDTSTTFSKEDSTTAYGERNYPYSSNIILKISKDKESRKTINGYDCYKVIYEYKENDKEGDEDYLEYIKDTVYRREMWVTDTIKSLYHPVVFEKAILEKFYPLDILETQNDMKGFERRFVLQNITLR